MTETQAIGEIVPAERHVARPRARIAFRLGQRRFWRDALRRRMLASADLLAIVVTTGALYVWTGGNHRVFGVLLFAPGWLLLAKLIGLYDLDHRVLRHLTTDEFARVLVYALAGTALMSAVVVTFPWQSEELGSGDRMRLRVLILFTTLMARGVARYAWRRVTPPERALLLGEGALAEQMRRKLALFPDIHIRIVRERETCSPADLRNGHALLDGVDRVIVAMPNVDEELLTALVREARARQVKLSVVPPVRGMFGTAAQLSHVGDVALVEFNTWDISRTTLFAKRALDVFVSGVLLILLAPVMLVVALGVRLTSPGPVLFVQWRAGQGGRPFKMLKFRTMRADSELSDVVDLGALDQPAFKLEDDPRVTPFGRFLRRASLDELPQLINVLRGEMSLVGPRPEQVEIVRLYRPEERFRLTAKPGLTGPMQVNGRGELTFQERLALERDYIENMSVARDLRFLALTVTPVLRRRGAY